MTHAITIELTFTHPNGYEYIDGTCTTLAEVERMERENERLGWTCTNRAIVVYEGQSEGLFSDNYTAPTEIARMNV